MKETNNTAGKAKKEDKQARLQEALRANLKRRKQAQPPQAKKASPKA